MNPPLRTEEDIDALIEGVADGTIDAIASDHAPHTVQEKEFEFTLAPFGIIGLETALPILLTELVHTGRIPLEVLIERLTTGPASILRLDKPSLEVGSIADLTLIDPDIEYSIDPTTFYSKSRNTPYGGRRAKGSPVMTIVNGNIKYVNPIWKVDLAEKS